MQRRLRQVLAPIPWGVDEMAAACLACFLWIEQVRHAAQDSKAMLSGQLAEGSYVHTRRALVDISPLWDWWEERT